MQRYDANNSYITLGNQLLLANQMLQQLMVSENTYDRVAAMRDHMSLLEGMLSLYYPFMYLEYFDEETKKMVTIKGYEKSMQHIQSKLSKNESSIEDKQTRGKYIYWLNRKYQLLSSCYGKLKLVPELSGGNDMGAVEDQIPEEVSNIPTEDDIGIPSEEEFERAKVVRNQGRPPKQLSELEKIKKEYDRLLAEADSKNKKTSKGVQSNDIDEPDFELEDEPTAD